MSDSFDWNAAYAGDGTDPVAADLPLLSLVPPVAGRALDLGCGTGGNTIALAEAGWDVTGVDIAPRAIATARIEARRRDAVVRFEVVDITTWRPRSGYDLVLCAFALPSRGRGRAAALRMAVDALAPDGMIIVAEFDVAMTRVFGTKDDFVDEAEMRRHLSGVADVSVERTLRPRPGGDATGAGMFGEHRVIVGVGRRPPVGNDVRLADE